jgi:hypothetical protein
MIEEDSLLAKRNDRPSGWADVTVKIRIKIFTTEGTEERRGAQRTQREARTA